MRSRKFSKTRGSGRQKVADLKGVFIFKFVHKKVEYLIAYRPPTDEKLQSGRDVEGPYIDFYKVGPHENFYSELKTYLKS